MTGSRTAADRKQEMVHQRKPVQDKLDETEVVTGGGGGVFEAGLRQTASAGRHGNRAWLAPAADARG